MPEQLKVCIVGPVTPFRGGIARHTTAVAQELARRADVDLSAHSFSKLYPTFLYPGEGVTDDSSSPPAGIEVSFRLNSMNPLSWFREIRTIVTNKCDLLIMPAWTFFLAPCLGTIALMLRRRGVRIALVVHNVADHEEGRWKALLSNFLLRRAHTLLTHTAELEKLLRHVAPDIPVIVRRHPVYDDYPVPKSDLPKRASLELLFFGLVRDYKGLDIALRALAASGRTDVKFTVAGEFWSSRSETEQLIEQLGISNLVELIPRYVDDYEAAELFSRCDALIAPYRSVTGSGVLSLATWYEKPVIVSDLPGFLEVVEPGSTGWVFKTGDIESLAQILVQEVDRESCLAMRPFIREFKQTSNWSGFVDALIAACLCGSQK
jgi:glycosyltransferase involved in cell wall biosynthesis